ncbi:MAG: imidazoleglycerol-phosphate dehydratase [Promethearchaeota archaeon CR_4]|nr:MAG: imidazoleglycerol-phosphate dehydratase [Candidatus Lokiarchaeota archaeon CR_4]
MPAKARTASVTRETKETNITIQLNLDGKGVGTPNTTVKFFDHLLNLLAKHGSLDLEVTATGDLQHHLIEDVGIALGQTFVEALGKKVGIERYGSAYVPMDETLARAVVDFSGRPYVVQKITFLNSAVEDMQTENFTHFLESFGQNALMNLHVEVLYGENDHHKIEAVIKALARAMKQAVKMTGKTIPSTKGKI